LPGDQPNVLVPVGVLPGWFAGLLLMGSSKRGGEGCGCAACWQVAKKVDELDLKLKDERGSSAKALDSMISSRSSLSIPAGMY
jgi:hypothetical protein